MFLFYLLVYLLFQCRYLNYICITHNTTVRTVQWNCIFTKIQNIFFLLKSNSKKGLTHYFLLSVPVLLPCTLKLINNILPVEYWCRTTPHHFVLVFCSRVLSTCTIYMYITCRTLVQDHTSSFCPRILFPCTPAADGSAGPTESEKVIIK